MRTVMGIFENGALHFPEPLPDSGRHLVLITFLDSQISEVLNQEFKFPQSVEIEIKKNSLLSPLELKILKLTHQGSKSPQIARLFKRHEGTIRNHLSRIYKKLGVRDRTEAIEKGLQLGYLEPLDGEK
mgnify:CR=1 FL=1